jgi:uncharacterized membrane protein YeaQ/YmgE (transglycosylase-associated protein family)
MEAHGIFGWLVIGGIAGWLASLFVKGGSSGVIFDIILGVVGAFLFGWIAQDLLHLSIGTGFIGSMVGSFVGAVALLFGYRAVRRMTNNT